MNKLLIALLLVSSTALADTWMSPNNAGGQIVLTDRKCSDKYPTLFQMYSRTSNGTTIQGCWALYDGLIQVVYNNDNQQYTYNPASFTKMQNY